MAKEFSFLNWILHTHIYGLNRIKKWPIPKKEILDIQSPCLYLFSQIVPFPELQTAKWTPIKTIIIKKIPNKVATQTKLKSRNMLIIICNFRKLHKDLSVSILYWCLQLLMNKKKKNEKSSRSMRIFILLLLLFFNF